VEVRYLVPVGDITRRPPIQPGALTASRSDV